MNIIDIHAHLSSCPEGDANAPEKLAALHARAGITGGLVAAFEGIFFQDPWEADSRLAEALAGTNYLQAQTKKRENPAYSMELSEITRALEIAAGVLAKMQ